MRGTVTHVNKYNAEYLFVRGADDREYVLRIADLPARRIRRTSGPVGEATALLGMVVQFDIVDTGSRKPDCSNVFVLIPNLLPRCGHHALDRERQPFSPG